LKNLLAALFLILLLSVTDGGDAWSASPPDAVSGGDPAQQILVMLHLPAPHFHLGGSYGGTYADQPGHGARRHLAEKLATQYGLVLLSDWPMPALGVDCYVMRVPGDRNVAEVVQRMSQDKRAEWVQPMNAYHALAREDSLSALQPSTKLWHLDELHKVSTGRGVRVAIVDSGVDSTHPDLADRIVVSRNFVDARERIAESHGTAVAGIIGARADDGARIVGIAPQASLMALRACWEVSIRETLCSSFTLAKALQFAIDEQAQVINLSLAGPQDPLLGKLLDVAIEHGSTVVSAVDPHLPGGGFPASHAGVLAVSDNIALAPFLFVPGEDIPTTAPGGRWNFVSGSSFSAAHVAGMVALVRELAPAMTMRQSAAWARFSTDSRDGPAGAIDACATLQRVAQALLCSRKTDQTARASW
jgi:hypothetical protein